MEIPEKFQKRVLFFKSYTRELKREYFDTLEKAKPGSNEEQILGKLIDSFYHTKKEAEPQLLEKVKLTLAHHTSINKLFILKENERKGLVSSALDNGLIDCAIFLINGLDKKEEEEIRNYYEKEAQTDGSGVWEDYQPAQAINPKNLRQKLILLSLYGTKDNSFAYKNDIADRLIKECDINPFNSINIFIPTADRKSEQFGMSPFLYFLEKKWLEKQTSKDPKEQSSIAIPFDLNFYKNIDPEEASNIIAHLAVLKHPKLADRIYPFISAKEHLTNKTVTPIQQISKHQNPPILKDRFYQPELF